MSAMTAKRAGGVAPARLKLLLSGSFFIFGVMLMILLTTSAVGTSHWQAPSTAATTSSTSASLRLSSSSASNEHNQQPAATEEIRHMLKGVQDQLAALQKALPDSIQQELKAFHASTDPHQQQHSPQQPPQQLVQQQPQQGSLTLPQAVKAHHTGQARAACDSRNATGLQLKLTDNLVAPVVIVAHNRVHYLAKCLMKLLGHWSKDAANAERFPLFVSVDNGEQATTQFAAALNYAADVQVIHNQRDSSRCKPGDGYCNLSVHYHMLLQLFFDCAKAPRLLFLEEDLEVAPDFFSYFAALAPVLSSQDLLCVSAWNDNGQRGRASNATALYRTDIFPGLGWMLTADVGRELAANWPDKYWDEYLRDPAVRKGRQCVFPEVPRTHTFGKVGTSNGAFFNEHFDSMLLNQDAIDWSKQDLSYLHHTAYAQQMADSLAAAEQLDLSKTDIKSYCDTSQPDHAHASSVDAVVYFKTSKEYESLAKQLRPMLTDLKGQGGPEYHPGSPPVPRTSYRGIVAVRCRGRRLFLAPEPGSPAQPTAVWQPRTQADADAGQPGQQ